ncbi:MAG TPA: MOSC domain-containing protein, partial [Steroidobacter sp.]|nr:MOSC domain-containing protein [Steroidobacter sp.]
FDPRGKRASDPRWTGGREALNQFTDGFPWLLISQASLDDLNARLPAPLPMNRFRPNIVIDGTAPYVEDRAAAFMLDGVTFRPVKPCTRCAITTTDQASAERTGEEPLRTLRSYRYSEELKGVLFGQNLALEEGIGREVRVGQNVEVS